MFLYYARGFVASRFAPLVLGFFAILFLVYSLLEFDRQIEFDALAASQELAKQNSALAIATFENIADTADLALILANNRLGRSNEPAEVHLVLRNLVLPTYLTQITVVSSKGTVVASNIDGTLHYDLQDREHINVHFKGPSSELFLGKLVIGRVSRERTLQFTRRFDIPGTDDYRIIVASIVLEQLVSTLSRMVTDPGTVVGVGRRDGTVLLRVSRAFDGTINTSDGDNVSRTVFFQNIAKDAPTWTRHLSPHDNIERVGTSSKSDRYGLVSIYAFNMDQIEAQLHPHRVRLWTLQVLISASIIIFGFAVYKARTEQITFRVRQEARNREADVIRRLSSLEDILVVIKEPNGVKRTVTSSGIVDNPTNDIDHHLRAHWEEVVNGIQATSDSTVRLKVEGQWRDIAVMYIAPSLTNEEEMIVATDQTSARLKASRIYELSKLASIGELSATVAHELHQPLATILMATHNARQMYGDHMPREVKLRLQRIEKQVERMKSRIKRLSYFGKAKDEFDVEQIDVRTLIEETVDFYAGQLQNEGNEIVLNISRCSHDFLILADANRIEQIIINLIQNARHAVASHIPPTDHGRITLSLDATDEIVRIEVSDNGGGISDEAKDRLFEPFFTTKSKGQGTGLGLSICQDIVDYYGGAIEWRNITDGACFIVTLPKVADRFRDDRLANAQGIHRLTATTSTI